MTTAELVQRGRLTQICPACGVVEAAGSYCTRCRRPMTESDWFVGPPRGRHASVPQAQAAEQASDGDLGLFRGAPAPRSAAVIPAAAPLGASGGKETGEPDQLLTGAPCQMDRGAP